MTTKQELITLIAKHYSVNKIAKELNCSYTNVRYHLRKHGLNTKYTSCNSRNCLECKASLTGMKRRFCSQRCKSRNFQNTKLPNGRTYFYQYQLERGIERKLKLMDLFGRKCEVCSYNKNLSALIFHHKDPQNKSFGLDIRKCTNTKWSSLLEEAKKCRLLCQNCHQEIHYPHLDMDKLHCIKLSSKPKNPPTS